MCSISDYPFRPEPILNWLLTPVRVPASCPSIHPFEPGTLWLNSYIGVDFRSLLIGVLFLILLIAIAPLIVRNKPVARTLTGVGVLAAISSAMLSSGRGAIMIGVGTVAMAMLCVWIQWRLRHRTGP